VTTLPLDSGALARAPDLPRRDVGWWGMALLCATEGALFAYLIASYFYLGSTAPGWPPAGIEPPRLVLPVIMMLILLSSSAVLSWGERGIRAGNPRRLRAGLGATIVLGLVFLALQAVEYHEKLLHFSPRMGAYPSLFYTITGFHGVHVTVGLLVLAFTAIRASRGHFTSGRYQGVSIAALYWHFVDGVWVVIVATLYVSAHLT
jgi:cytochrome c oxidase subunit III